MKKAIQKETLLDEIEQSLQSMIEQLEPIENKEGQRGRPRIVPALCLWGGLLVCVLRGMSSQLSLWRLLTGEGLWLYPKFPVTDEAIYRRLAKGGTQTLVLLFQQVSQLLKAQIEGYKLKQVASSFEGVYAIDMTTLDKVARKLPQLRGAEASKKVTLAGKLGAVFNIGQQQWHHVQHIRNPDENEKRTARDLLATVPVGALIVADLGYFAFRWFDELSDGGYWWLSRLRKNTTFVVHHVYFQEGDTFDGLVWLGKYRSDRAAHAVRLVTFRRGQIVYRYITNVLDPKQLAPLKIAQIYARRWDIEMAFKLIKRELGLHLLWSAKEPVILQQIWAILIISQILMALRLKIAHDAQVDPFDVSLKLIIEYLPLWSYSGRDAIDIIVNDGKRLGFIQPSRRIRIKAPPIPLAQITPLPDDLPLTRKPRYAGKDC